MYKLKLLIKLKNQILFTFIYKDIIFEAFAHALTISHYIDCHTIAIVMFCNNDKEFNRILTFLDRIEKLHFQNKIENNKRYYKKINDGRLYCRFAQNKLSIGDEYDKVYLKFDEMKFLRYAIEDCQKISEECID